MPTAYLCEGPVRGKIAVFSKFHLCRNPILFPFLLDQLFKVFYISVELYTYKVKLFMPTTIQQSFLKLKQNLAITEPQESTVSTRQKSIRKVMDDGI